MWRSNTVHWWAPRAAVAQQEEPFVVGEVEDLEERPGDKRLTLAGRRIEEQ